MTKQKKDYIQLNAKLDSALVSRFCRYCDEVGQTKTLALSRILDAFLREYESGKQPAGMFKSDL